MRIFISIFMVLALVMATSFPSMSHAMMPHNSAKVEKAEASEHSDCHHHGEAKAASSKAVNKDSSGHCCDKGMCKCATGACHGGIAMMGDSSTSSFQLNARKSQFGFSNQFVDSALPERLKRPPKA